MLIISDTNILRSFAAADALSLLTELFSSYTLHIPPAVEKELEAIPLVVVLRSLWTEKILSKQEVRELIQTMAKVEKLTLNQTQRDAIFGSSHRRRRRRKS
jgi:predicted nucleic acid-binding protein